MTGLHDRAVLGDADVDEARLAAMVADLLGHAPGEVEVMTSEARRSGYDLPSLTTVGRYWVSGIARTPRGERPFRLFVKHIQAWHHSPYFAHVPPEFQAFARETVPWRTEAAVYRSDLAGRLPIGLSMPRALGVFERDPDAVVLWLEPREHDPWPWDRARYERAAHLLGRMSGSAAVGELADVGGFHGAVPAYLHGRLMVEVVPKVLSDEAWRPYPVRAAFGDIEERLRSASARVEAYAHELTELPGLAGHGDACPNNLLPTPEPDDFVLIDYGFWCRLPVAFDLGQLVGGEIQLGRPPSIGLPELDALCVTAYRSGLAAEGSAVAEDVVLRAHALQLFLYSGISALPEPGMSAVQVRARAGLARHSLDLLERTGG